MTKRKNKGPNILLDLDCVNDCNGACCRIGTGIFMSRAEAGSNLLKIRTKTLVEPRDEDSEPIKLSEKDQAFQIPAGYGFFELVADCGHLSLKNTCSIYDNPSPMRPDACNGLVAGTLPCLVIRARAGFKDELQGDTARIVAEAIVD